MADAFSSLSPADQKKNLRKTRADADWAAATGPLGGVILQLRGRARAARWSGVAFLGMLVITVILGLGFYLGLPLVQGSFDGRQQALEDTLAGIEGQKGVLDRDRTALLLGGKVQDGTEVPGLPALMDDAFVYVPNEGLGSLTTPIVFGDRLFVFGESGTALRLAATGDRFELVATGTKQILFWSIVHGNRLFVFGTDGTALRLAATGDRFEPVATGIENSLSSPIVFGDRLFVFGTSGTALRLAATGDRFESVATGTKEDLGSPIVFGDRLFVFGDGGTALRLAATGDRFETVATGTGERLFSAIVHGDRLFVFGEGGTALRLDATGDRFEPIATGTGALLFSSIVHGDRLFVFGSGGTALRLAATGDRFEPIATGIENFLGSSIIHGDRLFVFGTSGTALRLAATGDRFETVATGTEDNQISPVVHGDRLFAFSDGGTALRLAATGDRFEPVATGTEDAHFRHIVHSNRLFAFGEGGTVLASTDTLSTAAGGLPPGPDALSSAAVAQFFDTVLPVHISDWEPVADIRNRLNLIASEYAGLELIETRTRYDLGKLANNPLQYLRDRKALEFNAFLANCRGEPPTPEITTACLTAWQSEETAGQRSWWETLADQLPPGILLLFLLATLGGLYRYNVRLAGFHDSRADFLTLISHGRSETQLRDILAKTTGDAQNLVALVLAADKVEMGAIRAKLGQAEIELAKTLAGKDE